jgi:hypothetical protein
LGILTAVLLLVVGAGAGLLFSVLVEKPPPPGASLASLIAAYPGDDASRTALAGWMGRAARAAGIPPELPVMAALVESGLANIQGGPGDSIGFFQMEKSVWNRGPFAGYWRKSPVQLRWFINQAITIRNGWVQAGDTDFGSRPRDYGLWAADIDRPAIKYRGRFHLRLSEARALLRAAGVLDG